MSSRLSFWASIMADKHDDICRKCGRCCYRKLWLEDTIYYTPTPCEYLDTETNRCTVYEKRHLVNPECLSVEEGIRIGVFPADCPYVKDLPDYTPPVEDVIDAAAVRMIEEGRITSPAELRRYARRRKARSKARS